VCPTQLLCPGVIHLRPVQIVHNIAPVLFRYGRPHDHRLKRRLARCLRRLTLSILVILLRSSVCGVEFRAIFSYHRNDTYTTPAAHERATVYEAGNENKIFDSTMYFLASLCGILVCSIRRNAAIQMAFGVYSEYNSRAITPFPRNRLWHSKNS
jgi:hypothetical protein